MREALIRYERTSGEKLCKIGNKKCARIVVRAGAMVVCRIKIVMRMLV